MTAEIVRLQPLPTTQERYQHLRDNAEAFVQGMTAMVAAAERDGDENLASKLRVWCLMPWQAALRDDDSGELWFTCEVCEQPIKDGTETSGEDCCWFHHQCISA